MVMKESTQEFNAVTTTRLNLRPATHADIPVINALMELSTRGLNSDDYNPTQVDMLVNHFIGADRQLIADGTYYVVEADGIIVGCGGWSRYEATHNNTHPHQTADYQISSPENGVAKVRLMYVHPDFKRMGIGSALMQRNIADIVFNGYRRVELLATLTGAPLYERFGFEIIEAQIFTLPNGVVLHGLQMGLALH